MLRHSASTVRIVALLLLTTVLSITAACARPARVVVREPAPRVVVVAKGHVHSTNCGHYRKGNTWYLVKGHKHGKRCGHVYLIERVVMHHGNAHDAVVPREVEGFTQGQRIEAASANPQLVL